MPRLRSNSGLHTLPFRQLASVRHWSLRPLQNLKSSISWWSGTIYRNDYSMIQMYRYLLEPSNWVRYTVFGHVCTWIFFTWFQNTSMIICFVRVISIATKRPITPITKVSSSYHLWVKCFSQLSFDSEVYTKPAAVADLVYTSESNEGCEKHLMQR